MWLLVGIGRASAAIPSPESHPCDFEGSATNSRLVVVPFALAEVP